MALPLEQLLSPVSGNPPCGDNKFDDFAYGMTLDADLQDIFGDGDGATQVGERKHKDDGDWPSFLSKVVSYFSYTKHLSLAYYASLADLNLTGLSGLVDGLTLMRQLLARYWNEVHPLLDDGNADERNDSLLLYESIDMLNSLSNLEVARGRLAGNYTLKDAMNSEASGVPEPAVVEAAINETLSDNPDFYEQLDRDLAGVRECLSGLKSDLADTDAKFDCSFAAFEERLGYIDEFLKGVGSGAEETISAEGGATGEAGGASSGTPVIKVSGDINSRADVIKSIDRIVRFYNRSEPASPVPQLLTRVKRIVDMNFTEIIDEFGLNRQSFDADSIFGSVDRED